MHVEATTSPLLADAIAGTSVGRAVEKDELQLRYQPVLDLADGAVVAVEALVRWWRPDVGLLMPETFLGNLAHRGELSLLDEWVLRTAVGQFGAWRRRAGGDDAVALHVNVSAGRVLAPGLPEVLAGAAAAACLPSDLLHVGVPAGMLADDLHAVAQPLWRLRAAGFGVVADGGGETTSAGQLGEVAVSGLKIERCYVAGMLTSARDRSVVERLVDIGHGLGLTVTAVGVEHEQQRAALLRLGCPAAQGWLFAAAAPLPEDGLPLLVR
jgi:EAL domain-containing protein (putative c-di-GMP-specific phosphodiesterase class I)